MSKYVLKEIPFTNDLGQVISPGELVISLVTGYAHRVTLQFGVYLGLYETPDGQKVVIQKNEPSYEYVHKVSGRVFNWNDDVAVKWPRYNHDFRNYEEYRKEYEKAKAANNEYRERNFKRVIVNNCSRTVLQINRVWPVRDIETFAKAATQGKYD